MFKNFFKKKVTTETPNYNIIPITSYCLNNGKSIYELKNFNDFMTMVVPEAAIFLTEENILFQEHEMVVLTCPVTEELLQQYLN